MSLDPFAPSASIPGHGNITLSLLPPCTPVLQTLSYQYPLKLISPSATINADGNAPGHAPALVHTVFLLTYGGGLVAGDAVFLTVNLAATTRLVLLTQGSTKIFKSPSSNIVTRQNTVVNIEQDAALCYLPDPVQPFEDGCFEQSQTYNLQTSKANLCVCDWVCEGRSARGESWSFRRYVSRNEIWSAIPRKEKRLLLRDNLILDAGSVANEGVRQRMDGLGVFGTLIICGELFAQLAAHFLEEFKIMPRIGAKQWDIPSVVSEQDTDMLDRAKRLDQEAKDGLLWTAASTRGFVVVKFGAREVEGARKWLRSMLKSDGTVERAFGERALLCLR